ncbi:MAG: acylphosphatase [Cyanobacteria bacterium NC_groundwater_1444_Ag_S-0.65um_54_12]|nr:acylphosphatase [Cyanobacteria bacterium NC_groundwater_1444_Ag_S-0.65um_54_12]
MHLHVLISGKVQGVWFRQHTCKLARSWQLCGWVRNLPDGRVEVLAQGPEESLKRLLAWLHEGPPLAHVEQVDASWELASKDLSDFQVR